MEDAIDARGKESVCLAARSEAAGKGLYVYMGFLLTLGDQGWTDAVVQTLGYTVTWASM